MALAALSSNSFVATPIQVNQQDKTNLQSTSPQVAQNSQKTAKAAQTDTITISAQALKMTDNNNAIANKGSEQKSLQVAGENVATAKNAAQKNAVTAYSAVSVNR